MIDKPSISSISQRLELENITRPEYINEMVHLYRGELGEASAWRSRNDTTRHFSPPNAG